MLTLLMAGCSTAGTTTIPKINKTPIVTPTSTIPPPSITPTSTRPFPNATQLDAYLTHLEHSGVLSGAVLVAHDGMLFEKGYDLADREANIPNTPQTRFRIGSITKQFTAMAVLILQDRGKLHVQDPVCLYVPNCPQDWQPITIENLLTHTSGIPDYINSPDFMATWTEPATPEELIARFEDLPLEFPPGLRFKYSNSGYTLLGYIIERVSGESYTTFLQQNIFTPLKMNNTGYDTTYPPLPQKLVSQQALNAMFTPHVPCPPPGPGGCLLHEDMGYGYGWFIAAEPQGRLIYHVGHIDGFFTYNGFYPTSDLVVVVLSNLETTDVLKTGLTLASMV
jgi:CubicO group peptidase (beta-lactamase class C family)